jgi:predicted secreted protein
MPKSPPPEQVRRRILTVAILATIVFAAWFVSGLHFGHRVGDFDPRANETSEGQCPRILYQLRPVSL